jgi:catechol 2,3-dioxygenase-like lactoylglutathione lyase family enzyme
MPRVAGSHHVALTVSDLERAQEFWTELLGLPLLMRTETFCALLTGSGRLQALFLTTHQGTREEPFSEFRVAWITSASMWAALKHSPHGGGI